MAIRILLAAPLLVAATMPAGEGLDTPTLLFITTAIVGVVVLRGVFLRRHLRKRRVRGAGRHTSSDHAGSDDSASSDGDGGGSCD